MAPFFEFYDLAYRFDSGTREIKVSGALEEGGALALRGPSGAGKSTLLRVLARLLKPDGGGVIFRGQDWYSISPGIWRRRVHYLSQKPVMFSGTVLDNLRMPFRLAVAGSGLDEGRSAELIEATGLSAAILGQDAYTLSGGETARVALVRAILVDPEVLLLDEPTAFLDEGAQRMVQSLLAKWLVEREGRGAVIVTHKDDDLSVFPAIRSVDVLPFNGEEGI